MSKRWSKKKAGKQRSKQRKAASRSGDGSAGGAGGTLGGFRGFMKAVAGTGGKKKERSPAEKAFDVLLWLAVAAAVFYFFSKQCA